jgi:hypothetical protein
MNHHETRAAILEAQTLAFVQALDAQGGPPIYKLTPADARNLLLGAQESAQVIKEPADLEDRTISGGPTGTISLRIVRRTTAAGARSQPSSTFMVAAGFWATKRRTTGWCANWQTERKRRWSSLTTRARQRRNTRLPLSKPTAP